VTEQDDRLDQRLLAQLWRLENSGEADERVALEGERYLSLFLDADNGRSYIFRHGASEANEDIDVGRESEVYEFETRHQAEVAFAEMVEEEAAEGRVVETDSVEDIGDPAVEGPVPTETGVENERDW
jgi:hypothetical protein